ncbi:MAG: sugar ABC transporter permease [bacterium]
MPYLWILPGLGYLFFFWGYPALYAVWLSLTETNLGSEQSRFVGLANFGRILLDPLFWISLKNSGVLAAASVVLEVSLGLGVAVHLHGSGGKRQAVVMAVLLLPWLFSEVVSALTWRWMFHEPLGMLNVFLRHVGLQGVPWMSRPATAMATVVIVSLWQGIGISTMVVLAALKGIPGRLTDLALLDGAEGWSRLRHVLLPQLKGVLMLDGLLVAIKSLGAFTLVFALTGGGPGYATEILATYIYRLSFYRDQLGYASAVGVCLACLFLAFTWLLFLLPRGDPGRFLERTR